MEKSKIKQVSLQQQHFSSRSPLVLIFSVWHVLVLV